MSDDGAIEMVPFGVTHPATEVAEVAVDDTTMGAAVVEDTGDSADAVREVGSLETLVAVRHQVPKAERSPSAAPTILRSGISG